MPRWLRWGKTVHGLFRPRRGSSRNRTYRGPVYSQPCHLDSSTAEARILSGGGLPGEWNLFEESVTLIRFRALAGFEPALLRAGPFAYWRDSIPTPRGVLGRCTTALPLGLMCRGAIQFSATRATRSGWPVRLACVVRLRTGGLCLIFGIKNSPNRLVEAS